jgi:hypothetical protein
MNFLRIGYMSRLTFIAEAQATIIVTIAYVILFVVTFGALMPIQAQFFDWLSMSISLLFLPHGVRVLAVYLYGWRAILYLLPGHLVTWGYLRVFLESEQGIYSALISICASFLAVCLVFRSWSSHSDSQLRSHWLLIIIAGAVASIGNGLGHAIWHGSQLDATWITLMLGFFIGDVSGLFFLLLLLIAFNKAIRQHGAKSS